MDRSITHPIKKGILDVSERLLSGVGKLTVPQHEICPICIILDRTSRHNRQRHQCAQNQFAH